MVGMEDQYPVDRARQDGAYRMVFRRHGKQHVQEILGVREVVARVNERLADRILVRHRGDGGHLGDQAMRSDLALAGVVDVERIVVERAHRADHADQDRHRVRIAAKPAVEIRQLLVQHRVVGDVVGELFRSSP